MRISYQVYCKNKKEFNAKYASSPKIKELLKNKTSQNSYLFAKEVGQILANVFESNLTMNVLPDGKMYFNIAERILFDTLGTNHKLVTQYASQMQSALNKEAKIGLKPREPSLNKDKIKGIVNRVSYEENYDDIKWIMKDPIVNFTQSVVDDFIMENVNFHGKSGLKPQIKRYVVGKCCDWCEQKAGTYSYPVDKSLYARHENCDCIVEYHPKDGRGIQNSYTKQWR